MTEQRNLILAIVLSIVILLGFQFLYEIPRLEQREAELAQQRTEETAPAPAPGVAPAPGLPAAETPRTRAEIVAAEERIEIRTPRLHGSISTIGGRIDDLTLADYHVTPDPASPEIELLSPPGTPGAYYAEFGWVPDDPAVDVPGPTAEWEVQGGPLTPGSPVLLTWRNDEGLVFERVVEVDENYVFTVTQRVRNETGAPVTLRPYGLIVRHGTPETMDFYILHEGPIGVLGESLKEYDYDDLQEEREIRATTTRGWLGITDKYWLVSLLPEQGEPFTGTFRHRGEGRDVYAVDALGEPVTVAPGAAAEETTRLFAGAKRLELLEAYQERFGLPLFDRAIDFGWFWFLTIPFFHALKFLGDLFGNFGVAILVFTVGLKLVFFPLANRSYRAMSKMKKLQPEVMRLRERFGDDRMRMNQELMELYRREKANPVSGCLPILIQIPVFFALYKVLFVTLEMRHAPFFGWIRDLSAPDPTSIFNLFGLIPWTPPDILMIGVWPLVMGITMYLQQKLNPPPPDPVQAKVFMALPIVFTFMLAAFPAGLVIYWAWNNALSILQQWVIMRRMGVSISGGTTEEKPAPAPEKTPAKASAKKRP